MQASGDYSDDDRANRYTMLRIVRLRKRSHFDFQRVGLGLPKLSIVFCECASNTRLKNRRVGWRVQNIKSFQDARGTVPNINYQGGPMIKNIDMILVFDQSSRVHDYFPGTALY